MKFISTFVFVAVISLPFVSLYGLYSGFGYLTPKYVSSYITAPRYDGIKYVSSYVEPNYFGRYLSSYIAPQIIYPPIYYSYAPITPLQYYYRLFSPIHHYGLGGYKIIGPGLPTHPGYKPPTMWKRLWPPTNSTDNDSKEVTTTTPEPADDNSSEAEKA